MMTHPLCILLVRPITMLRKITSLVLTLSKPYSLSVIGKNWLHVFKFYGVKEIFCCINESLGLSSLLRTEYKAELISRYSLHKLMKQNSDDCWLIIIEGSPCFVLPKVLFVKELILSITVPEYLIIAVFSRRIKSYNLIHNAEWCRISHHNDYGGGTVSAVQVAIIPKSGWSRFKLSDHKWTLRDFVKSTVREFLTQYVIRIRAKDEKKKDSKAKGNFAVDIVEKWGVLLSTSNLFDSKSWNLGNEDGCV